MWFCPEVSRKWNMSLWDLIELQMTVGGDRRKTRGHVQNLFTTWSVEFTNCEIGRRAFVTIWCGSRPLFSLDSSRLHAAVKYLTNAHLWYSILTRDTPSASCASLEASSLQSLLIEVLGLELLRKKSEEMYVTLQVTMFFLISVISRCVLDYKLKFEAHIKKVSKTSNNNLKCVWLVRSCYQKRLPNYIYEKI